jgi:alkanesulfonate monooxygenase SsuD/methylene tetrahydromethanopterin reductase-like flavin-dependent oxidoreductase (luciferase family)
MFEVMKFSVWPYMEHPVDETLDIARWADAAGWYGIWYADHYMPNTGTEEIKPGDTHECWAMLPAIAMVTEHLRIGPLVAPTSVHHPAVLANRATTIDHLSGGRMVLGLGAGWQINEHVAYGIELEPPGRRVRRFDEAIQIIRALTTHDRTTFDGDVYTITDATADPKPVQARLPILVGTAGPRMLRLTARYADEWNTWGNLDTAAGKRRAFAAACAAEGRDERSLHTSVQALVVITDSADVVARAGEGPFGDRTLAGSTAQIVDAIGRYGELGFDEFIIPNANLGRERARRQEALARIDAEIVSQFTVSDTASVVSDTAP